MEELLLFVWVSFENLKELDVSNKCLWKKRNSSWILGKISVEIYVNTTDRNVNELIVQFTKEFLVKQINEFLEEFLVEFFVKFLGLLQLRRRTPEFWEEMLRNSLRISRWIFWRILGNGILRNSLQDFPQEFIEEILKNILEEFPREFLELTLAELLEELRRYTECPISSNTL